MVVDMVILNIQMIFSFFRSFLIELFSFKRNRVKDEIEEFRNNSIWLKHLVL